VTAATRAPLLPGATIGVLGGGQLGRMLAMAARRMGYRVCVLDPDPSGPTGQFADEVVVGALSDASAALELGARCQVATLDTEHVPHAVLEALELRVPVRPSAKVLRTIQDRLVQKTFLDRLAVPQASWAPVGSAEELAAAVLAVGLPAILKARRAGYDGKGQARVEPGDDPDAAWARIRREPAVLESVVRFDREVSVLLARGLGGEVAFYPIAENEHRRHILHTTSAPARISPATKARAETLASQLAAALDHVGVIAVEMFVVGNGEERLLVNEIAPRTHNSGHYTFGACATSQFEQHVRAVCGLPLGDPSLLQPAVMLNLIGDLWRDGLPPWHHVFALPNAHLHLYGKELAAPGRKMGHVLLLDDDLERARTTAETLLARLTPSPR
jgi:5-(carboxyamino)imidazole ribonucleotide synthase